MLLFSKAVAMFLKWKWMSNFSKNVCDRDKLSTYIIFLLDSCLVT